VPERSQKYERCDDARKMHVQSKMRATCYPTIKILILTLCNMPNKKLISIPDETEVLLQLDTYMHEKPVRVKTGAGM
jgi:hypothetical protein